MGLMTAEEIENGKVKWLSINQANGEFEHKGKTYPAIKGKLLGFDTHEFDFKGKSQVKFDIYLEDRGDVYDVQFGIYSWVTWRLLNMLASVADLMNGNDSIMIRAGKEKDNYNISVFFNNKACKWKLKWEEAGLKGLDANSAEARRNKMIDKWAALFIEKKHYEPAQVEEHIPDDEMPNNAIEDEVPF